MTGLNPETEQIIEVASIITTPQLEVIAEGPTYVIGVTEDRLQKMDDWNREHHTASGLWDATLASKTTIEEAQAGTLDFLQTHIKKGKGNLAGNSVWQDRRFMVREMPDIIDHLHYRLIDVTTVKNVIKSWFSEKSEYKKPNSNHRALEDVRQSIDELRFYKENFFKGH
jgi:oligoribonuclease